MYVNVGIKEGGGRRQARTTRNIHLWRRSLATPDLCVRTKGNAERIGDGIVFSTLQADIISQDHAGAMGAFVSSLGEGMPAMSAIESELAALLIGARHKDYVKFSKLRESL